MSFILDALKKSETDRQQSSSTEFAAIPSNPVKPSVPRWLWVVGLLLATNLIVLIGLLLRGEDPAATSKPIQQPPEQVERQQDANSFEEQVATARNNPPPKNEPLASVAPEDTPSPELQAVLISPNPASVRAKDLYPSIQEVRASNTIPLPDLHLDIHVYSEVPADRFVFINMAKLREGSHLEEGPVVVEITPVGVVLRHLGTSFLVPRD